MDKNGNIVIAPSILLDKNGIGDWSEADFIKSIKTGKHPKTGKSFEELMQVYSVLSDKEIKAIYTYIGSVSHVKP